MQAAVFKDEGHDICNLQVVHYTHYTFTYVHNYKYICTHKEEDKPNIKRKLIGSLGDEIQVFAVL